MYHIISIRDLERKELDYLLDRAREFDTGNYQPRMLEDKLAALLFFEPSTRTRMSFATAMARLGGRSISVDSVEASSIVKGETLADTIRCEQLRGRHRASPPQGRGGTAGERVLLGAGHQCRRRRGAAPEPDAA
jgi:aspartate carbamoyltransferase catalytic subunit